jgi:Ca2+-binding EF-hand superfamily protein
MFRSFDKDGDGKVDASEVLAALGHDATPQNLRAAEALVKSLDTDGDGRLDPEEFAQMFSRKTVGK